MKFKDDQNIDIRRLIGQLNKPGRQKLNLKVNYYEFPPENEMVFRNNITREAFAAMQSVFDPIWLRDKHQDWIKMNIRELLTDLLHYFHFEVEVARYERIHHYFGPEEVVRIDMSKRPIWAAKVLSRLRIGLGLNRFREKSLNQ